MKIALDPLVRVAQLARRACGCIQCLGGYPIGARTIVGADGQTGPERPTSCIAAHVVTELLRVTNPNATQGRPPPPPETIGATLVEDVTLTDRTVAKGSRVELYRRDGDRWFARMEIDGGTASFLVPRSAIAIDGVDAPQASDAQP